MRLPGEKACRLFLLLALVAAVSGTAENTGDSESEAEATPFDYFIFSQQWPGTYCKGSGTCCDSLVETESFTIHGVWPENEDNSYPVCCTGPAYDQANVDELTDLLVQYWPTLSCSSPTQCNGKKTGTFWQHEVFQTQSGDEKHGTCSYPTIPDEVTYFIVGLNLRLKYDISTRKIEGLQNIPLIIIERSMCDKLVNNNENVYGLVLTVNVDMTSKQAILEDASIVPSSTETYESSVVKDTIEQALGAKITMSCSGKYIYEVWVCFTKDLKIRDCGTVSATCSSALLIPPLEVTASVEEI